ncbi:MAG: ParA family protein [Candidatus Competibacter sp.]|nr:ParA family protein [Candidatus Competibacter sp.]
MTIPVVAFLTMKGGVGKTTLAANISRSFADLKPRKILLIDADAQCNLSQVFFDSDAIETGSTRSLYQAFDTKGRSLFASDLKIGIHPKVGAAGSGSTIDFIMGSFDTFELNATANAARREAAAERFASFIEQAKREYDLILIDTNPSATFVTMQTLANANFIVAPITFDAFSMQGIHLVVHHLKQTYPWLGNPARFSLVANKVPRAPSDSDLRRMEFEEAKIKSKYPLLARSIKLERIHASDIIANRPVGKGFLADHNGVEGGFYDRIVQDFDAVAAAIDMDIKHAFDAPQTQVAQSPERPTSWFREWFGIAPH